MADTITFISATHGTARCKLCQNIRIFEFVTIDFGEALDREGIMQHFEIIFKCTGETRKPGITCEERIVYHTIPFKVSPRIGSQCSSVAAPKQHRQSPEPLSSPAP